MAVGDGVTWNEALPDNNTTASEIDDYDRDLRVGVRSRLALEHVWPSSQTATSEGGRHTFVTFQAQTAAPTMAGTTGGGLYVTTAASPALVFVRSDGSEVTLVNTAGTIPIAVTGTLGGLIIASSASPTTVEVLAGSADGRVLHTHSNTAASNWLPIDLAGTSTVLSGVLGVSNGGSGTTLIQHGRASVGNGGVVTFPTTMGDTNYTLIITAEYNDNNIYFGYGYKTATGFTFYTNGGTVTVDWLAIKD